MSNRVHVSHHGVNVNVVRGGLINRATRRIGRVSGRLAVLPAFWAVGLVCGLIVAPATVGLVVGLIGAAVAVFALLVRLENRNRR